MKRFFFAPIAAVVLLVPTLASAQVTTVYIPGAHPRVVVQPVKQTPAANVENTPLAPAQVIARHESMSTAQRVNPHVNYSAVAHCDRAIAEARDDLRKGF